MHEFKVGIPFPMKHASGLATDISVSRDLCSIGIHPAAVPGAKTQHGRMEN